MSQEANTPEKLRGVATTSPRPEGFNLGANDGLAAGQTILQFHLHVIPRRGGDVPDPRGGIRWVTPEKARYCGKDGAGGVTARDGCGTRQPAPAGRDPEGEPAEDVIVTPYPDADPRFRAAVQDGVGRMQMPRVYPKAFKARRKRAGPEERPPLTPLG